MSACQRSDSTFLIFLVATKVGCWCQVIPVILLDEVDIISPNNDGPVHLGGPDSACNKKKPQ